MKYKKSVDISMPGKRPRRFDIFEVDIGCYFANTFRHWAKEYKEFYFAQYYLNVWESEPPVHKKFYGWCGKL